MEELFNVNPALRLESGSRQAAGSHGTSSNHARVFLPIQNNNHIGAAVFCFMPKNVFPQVP